MERALVRSERPKNWVVPLFARYDGTFGFFDFLKGMTPDVTDEGYDGYAGVKNPEIKADKPGHFALGIYWKAAVHSWSFSKKIIGSEDYTRMLRLVKTGLSAAKRQ